MFYIHSISNQSFNLDVTVILVNMESKLLKSWVAQPGLTENNVQNEITLCVSVLYLCCHQEVTAHFLFLCQILQGGPLKWSRLLDGVGPRELDCLSLNLSSATTRLGNQGKFSTSPFSFSLSIKDSTPTFLVQCSQGLVSRWVESPVASTQQTLAENHCSSPRQALALSLLTSGHKPESFWVSPLPSFSRLEKLGAPSETHHCPSTATTLLSSSFTSHLTGSPPSAALQCSWGPSLDLAHITLLAA